MSAATVWPAPAKLNLFLHVTGRRSDGYHDLQTVFQLIDLADDIHIAGASGWPDRTPGGPGRGAARGRSGGARGAGATGGQRPARLAPRLSVTKRIPMGGGLGGGSSDAATVLVALNRLWNCGLNEDDLAAIGVELGADVPVFVRGHSAWAEGRGERLMPLELPERWFALVHPRVHVPTAAVFQAPELTRNSPPITMGGFLQSGGRNDFEPVVRARYPEVAQRAGLAGALRTGAADGHGVVHFRTLRKPE